MTELQVEYGGEPRELPELAGRRIVAARLDYASVALAVEGVGPVVFATCSCCGLEARIGEEEPA